MTYNDANTDQQTETVRSVTASPRLIAEIPLNSNSCQVVALTESGPVMFLEAGEYKQVGSRETSYGKRKFPAESTLREFSVNFF